MCQNAKSNESSSSKIEEVDPLYLRGGVANAMITNDKFVEITLEYI